MTTQITPSLGHAPGFTQQGVGTTPGYDMIDLRRAATSGLQEGVIDAGSYMVTQRVAGATMTVDIAAGSGDAYVLGDSVGKQGLYYVPPHSAAINEAIAAAHASLPRVDAVILEIQDNVHDASTANLARVRVVTGTATAGATLDNARDGSHGGAAVPINALHLADVLVGAGVTSITNAVIRDRRKWARGALCHVTRASDATTASATDALIDSTNLQPRIECAGVPVRLTLETGIRCTVAAVEAVFGIWMDGAALSPALQYGDVIASNSLYQNLSVSAIVTPSAGSHRFGPTFATGGGTLTAMGATTPIRFTVEELVAQNSPNNSVTTG